MPDDSVGPLWRRLRTSPRVADPERVRWRLVELTEAAGDDLRALLEAPRVRALVAGIADHSPFLWALIARAPERFLRLLDGSPEANLDAILAPLHGGDRQTENDLMRRLRHARQEIALLVALADLGGVWPLEAVVIALSRAADTFVREALGFLLGRAGRSGKLRIADPSAPEVGCGVAILGLGKLGGCELNYSSDIDIIVVFDAASQALVKRDEASTLFVRMVRDLVRILQQPTEDGFVLRVDLRLRPDPGATAVAIGLGAAFLYYEAFGQNWERAAMIKARWVAGDAAVARAFVDGLSPFIWRKYFDYAAIADIHAMKRQIHAAKGSDAISVAGHNVKLGRGGIREIEFFVQTQQLIFGGKRPELRGSRTLPMLRALRRDGWIGSHAVADLTRAYDFLRRIEHRLQMVGDEQTHRLPAAPDALERFARFCGFASAARFDAVLTRHLRTVAHHYALLFENAPDLADVGGSLVFTGIADDPETIETLAKLGFRAPETVARMVREWHSGRRLGVRTARARETLTDLVPKLLVTFAHSADPDAAVAAFDKALERMPAAAELFAILAANDTLRDLFGAILGGAPRLAEAVMLRPHLLDAAIGPQSAICRDEDVMEARVTTLTARTRTTEEFLDAIRDVQHEEHFLIGVRLLSGDLDVDEAGAAYTTLAVAIIRTVLDHLVADFVADHGRVAGAAIGLIAMGKLGSREMTATSDLDLVLIYDFDAEQPQSDGPRPLHAAQYFTKLTQRLVSHLTVATRRGRLYEVDMRLRPSGRQGPLATKIGAFGPYQREEAQTWEHMALTRARAIAGDAALGARITTEIAAVLRRPPTAGLAGEVAAMRALIEREKPPKGAWDLKLLPGGLIDIEFLAQYLVLRHAATSPAILDPSTQVILREASALGHLDRAAADCLIAAHRLYAVVTQVLRLALADDQPPEVAGNAVRQRLAAAASVPDFARVEAEIGSARQAVRETFLALLSTA